MKSPFYHLYMLCDSDELNSGVVGKVIVDGDPSHVVEGYWHQLRLIATTLRRRTLVITRHNGGTLLRLCSAEQILQLLIRVYIVEGRLLAAKLAGLLDRTWAKPFLRWKVMGRRVGHRFR